MQGSSGAPQDNTEKRISDDAAKTLQNILNAVRTSLEDEFAIQQMEYDEVYGVESEEFERYQVQVADWLRENRLVDAVVDMLPLSCFMNSPAPAQQASPDPQSQEPDQQQPQYQDPQYQDPQYQDPQYQDPQYQEAQPEPLQAPVHSYDEQSTSYVNMQPPPTSAEAPIPPAFAPPPPPEPQPAAAVAQSAGWPEQPWGPPPGRPAEPEQQSSQGNPWAQSDDDSGWYTGAAPGETTQTQDAVQSDGASQWTQPQWNSSVEASDSREGGFESGGWAAVQEESAPEPEVAPVQYADTASPFAAPAPVSEPATAPAPAQPPAPATGWAALEPPQDPSPAPAQASGWAAPESAPVSAPAPAQESGWAAPESASAQEPAPTPTWPAAPESAPAPSWPPAPEPAPVPEPQPETAPVFQSIPAPSPDQSVQQQPAPAPVPDPRKREESEEDYTYDPTTAWG